MEVTIRPLGPENANQYLSYLQQLDFHHAPDWAGCFCRFYHTTCSDQEWKARSAATNRQDALESILNGSMSGFLAVHEDQVVGWINANAIESYVRLTEVIKPYITHPKTGGIMCFVIHPDFRRQGIAKALLKAAVDQFERDGYGAVLAYPFDSLNAPEKAYHGTQAMYADLGFKVIEARDGMAVMRKDLI